MFEIRRDEDGTVVMNGRLDAAAAPRARRILEAVEDSCTIDFSELDYIASVGLGLLAAAQRRLLAADRGLRLSGLSPHLKEVMCLAGFDGVFDIE